MNDAHNALAHKESIDDVGPTIVVNVASARVDLRGWIDERTASDVLAIPCVELSDHQSIHDTANAVAVRLGTGGPVRLTRRSASAFTRWCGP